VSTLTEVTMRRDENTLAGELETHRVGS
jgi:hypothetical protein